ncbi:hypothetical protein AAEO56_03280 [Flavobacterium sp. DGU11]|uniref:Addiction module component n=1 Tax=Flavobacterium arundinis TaxID=3139143 RepID=A0ABU9HSY5_9FLAO
MEAIRQYVKVNGRNISITLPDDFDADEVEVIILARNNDYDDILTDEMKAMLDQRVNEPTENYISGEESLEQIRKRYGL